MATNLGALFANQGIPGDAIPDLSLDSRKLKPDMAAQAMTTSPSQTISGTTLTDIGGASIAYTAPINEQALVLATFEVSKNFPGGTSDAVSRVIEGHLKVDGVDNPNIGTWGHKPATTSGPGSFGNIGFSLPVVWVVALSAGAHTLQLAAKLDSAAGVGETWRVWVDGTRFTMIPFAA